MQLHKFIGTPVAVNPAAATPPVVASGSVTDRDCDRRTTLPPGMQKHGSPVARARHNASLALLAPFHEPDRAMSARGEQSRPSGDGPSRQKSSPEGKYNLPINRRGVVSW